MHWKYACFLLAVTSTLFVRVGSVPPTRRRTERKAGAGYCRLTTSAHGPRPRPRRPPATAMPPSRLPAIPPGGHSPGMATNYFGEDSSWRLWPGPDDAGPDFVLEPPSSPQDAAIAEVLRPRCFHFRPQRPTGRAAL